jgi:ParB family chromosome partitioning protein
MEKYVLDKIEERSIEDLIPYFDHPFQVYEGKKLDELTESIKAQGIISPLIVRPHSEQDKKYEILAGHNRRIAAGNANLTKVPVIIRYDLKGKDDEALLVVIETNLIQRSFKDLSYGERAKAIFMYHEALKRQRRRSDLTNQTGKALAEASEFRQVGEKLNSDEETARNFELSPRTVSRYLQIYRLSKPLLDRLDKDEFAFDPAINISYLREAEQKHLDSLLGESDKYKLTMKNADAMRKASAKSKKALSKTAIKEIVGKRATTKKEDSPVITVLTKLTTTIIRKYSSIDSPTEDDTKKLIEDLRNALDAAIAELTT